MDKPLVSIVMPFYNAERFIESAIHSVIAQTYTNWELLIIDDCSSDNSPAIVQQFINSDKRIHMYKNQTNKGVAASRNVGIDSASGLYTAFLDADDLWAPDKLELQTAFMMDHGYGITYTAQGFINDDNQICDRSYHPPQRVSHKALFYTNVLCCSSVMVQTDLMKNHKFEENVFHEDYVSWLLIVEKTKFAWGLDQTLTYYRIMDGTKSANKLRSARGVYNIFRQYFRYGLLKSCWFMMFYAFHGFRKYLLRN